MILIMVRMIMMRIIMMRMMSMSTLTQPNNTFYLICQSSSKMIEYETNHDKYVKGFVIQQICSGPCRELA